MAIDDVKRYLARWGRDGDVLELPQSTATVAEAAAALGTEGARIAKSVALRHGDGAVVVVVAGDMKIDNRKFKERFGVKASMLRAEDALRLTGHAAGGVCPFALPDGTEAYLDESLRRFETVFPAAGSGNSAIELRPDELAEYSRSAGWVDVSSPIQ
jgi:prolyl-tRNA editing enzyme YbaK/EbsC (Cys-tRNA(Pro) deacylase)